MAAGRVVLLVAVASISAVTAIGCGDDDPSDGEEQVRHTIDQRQQERRAKVERAVEDGRLPPVALELFEPDGTINISFIDGPNGDEDVVRTDNGGRSGPKLTWDLNQDGRIDRDERTITERELYDATLGLPSG